VSVNRAGLETVVKVTRAGEPVQLLADAGDHVIAGQYRATTNVRGLPLFVAGMLALPPRRCRRDRRYHRRHGGDLHLPGIFPDYQAPIIRRGRDGERELVMARWRMPTHRPSARGR
jgi:hypothetical protein